MQYKSNNIEIFNYLIQNIIFFVYIMSIWVCTVFTHPRMYTFKKNMLRLYIKYIYI